MAKIDWLAAREYYLSDATASYTDVSKKFGVSLKAVKDRGAKEGWLELRQNLSEKAYENFQKKLLRTKEAAQDRHLLQFQNLQALINKRVIAISSDKVQDAQELRRLASALKDSVMGERIVLGLPTSVGSITDPEGNDAIKGFAELVLAARKADSEPTTSQAD